MVKLRYSPYIDPYINRILKNEVERCKEQEQMIQNIVIPVLERDDVIINNERIEEGLSLQKYFPYKLIEWEIFLFALIVGVLTTDGDIFFSDIRIIVGRGSGKNGFISFLCFYFLSPYHGITGYNVDLLANSEDQAKTSFNDVYEIIDDPVDPEYRRALKANYYHTKEIIKGIETKSVLRFNTSSKRGKDSKRTGCVIYDEKHEYLDDTNIGTLKSGLGKVPHAREITITTDGHVRGGVLDREKEQNKKILSEYNPDNRTLVFWCRIEAESEWNQIDKLVKAIPSLNDFKSLRTTILKEIREMPYTPDYYQAYMAKRCNYPVGNQEVEVATWEDIQAATKDYDFSFTSRECVGGVDYSMTNDFTGVCLLFKQGEGYVVLHHTFVCRQSRDLRGIVAPLAEWERKGDLTFIDDVEIPAETVANWFAEQIRRYNLRLKKIGIDKFRYGYLNKAFKAIGYDAFEIKNIRIIRPSDIMQAAPLINSAFINQKIAWGKTPIMAWMTNNVKKVIEGGNVRYDKQDPHYRKTDTFMAFVNCMVLEEELEGQQADLGMLQKMKAYTF